MVNLKLNNITKTFGKNDSKVIALNNVSLEIKEGELVAITGASGSGKSTLLNILGLIEKSTNGEYLIENEDASKFSDKKMANKRNEILGFIVQHFALIDGISIEKNIELPLLYGKIKKKKRKERIEELLDQLNIKDKRKRMPTELSGGQCQRVAIGRALANNPKIILADEPTGALDSENGRIVMDILKELNKSGTTVIIVTHDKNIAKECKREIIMKDGRILNEKQN
ncbi:MAG: ABC transporter ATP-binding protein [Clostridium sp.]